jgi:hypothetical protein
LSITYSHSDNDEAVKRIKQASEGIIKENKELKVVVGDLQKQVEAAASSQKANPQVEKLESTLPILTV